MPDAVRTGDKEYKPIEPNEVGEPRALEPVSLEYVLQTYYADEDKAEVA